MIRALILRATLWMSLCFAILDVGTIAQQDDTYDIAKQLNDFLAKDALEKIVATGQIAIQCMANIEPSPNSPIWSRQYNTDDPESFEILSQFVTEEVKRYISSASLKNAFSHASVTNFQPHNFKETIVFWIFFNREQLKDVEMDLLSDPREQLEHALWIWRTDEGLKYVSIFDAIRVDPYRKKTIVFEGIVYQNGRPLVWKDSHANKQSMEYREVAELLSRTLQEHIHRIFDHMNTDVREISLSPAQTLDSTEMAINGLCTVDFNFDNLERLYPFLIPDSGASSLAESLNNGRPPNGINEYTVATKPHEEDKHNITVTTVSTLWLSNAIVPWSEAYRNPDASVKNVVNNALCKALDRSNLGSYVTGISDFKFNKNENHVVVYITIGFSTASMTGPDVSDMVNIKQIVFDKLAQSLVEDSKLRDMILV